MFIDRRSNRRRHDGRGKAGLKPSLVLKGCMVLVPMLMLLPSGIAASPYMEQTPSYVAYKGEAPQPPRPLARELEANLGHSGDVDQPLLVQARNDTGGAVPDQVESNKWTNVYPGLTVASAISGTEVWAAGEYGHLVRYDGESWIAVDPPALRGHSIVDLNMISSNSGWAISGDKAFNYNGTNWVEQSNGLPSSYALARISAASASDVWAIGALYPNADSLVHWNGSSWVGVTLPNAQNYCPFECDVSMIDSTEGWAVAGPVAYHYVSGVWSPVDIGSRELKYAYALPGELWATGTGGGGNQIFRYSLGSGTWTDWPLPNFPQEQPYDIYMVSSTQGWVVSSQSVVGWDGTSWNAEYAGDVLQGISGANGEVWAVGYGDTVLHRVSSTVWEKQHGGPTSNHINGVAMLGTNDGWAVARATVSTEKTLLRFTGGTWQVYTTTLATSALNAIQMLSPTEGYVVGSNMIAHWNGTTWAQMPAPSANLYALYMLSNQEGWAVGAGGRILHYANGQWTQESSPTTRNLRTVFMDSPTHGWAGGGGFYFSTLLEYNAGAWTDATSTLPTNALYIRGMLFKAGGAEGWIVGWPNTNAPAILHYLNGVWSAEGSPGVEGYTSVAPEALGEYWAVSCSAGHRVGSTWDDYALPISFCLYGVSLVPGRGGWAVGPYGSILQYNPLDPGQTFYDVPSSNPFYDYIACMVNHNIISGYADDNTFRPNNNVTRGQLAKILSNSAGYADTISSTQQTFTDVPYSNPYWLFIERAYLHGAVNGYTSSPPCTSGTPCFLPFNNATRGQIAKIDSLAVGYNEVIPSTQQTFDDVPPSNTFWLYIERVSLHAVISGYNGTGSTINPCTGNVEQVGYRYFRPCNNATRGQTAKIVANTFFPSCTIRR